jgi:transposase
MRQFDLKRVVYGLEPTGNYHKPLGNWLLDQGQLLVLVTSKSIADNRQTLDGRWDKNDTKDSANVADLLCQGKCQFYERVDGKLEQLRTLLLTRRRLKKGEIRLRLQIRNGLVCKHFPELDRLWGQSAQENLAIVRWCLDPRQITQMPFEEFVLKVTTCDRGLRQRQRLRAIYDVAPESIGIAMGSADRHQARLLVDQLRLKQEQFRKVMGHIEKACRDSVYYQLLLTIPGFGPYIAALVLARIGEPMRFSKRKQVLRLAGMDLSAKRSGKRSKDIVPVLSKKGNTELRYALYQAAHTASCRNDTIRELFTRYLTGREKEPGIRKKMRVKLAAKLLVVAWTMMKNHTAFDASLLLTQ